MSKCVLVDSFVEEEFCLKFTLTSTESEDEGSFELLNSDEGAPTVAEFDVELAELTGAFLSVQNISLSTGMSVSISYKYGMSLVRILTHVKSSLRGKTSSGTDLLLERCIMWKLKALSKLQKLPRFESRM